MNGIKYADPSEQLSEEARLFRTKPEGGIEDNRLEFRAGALRKELIEMSMADVTVLKKALSEVSPEEIDKLEVLARRLLLIVKVKKSS